MILSDKQKLEVLIHARDNYKFRLPYRFSNESDESEVAGLCANIGTSIIKLHPEIKRSHPCWVHNKVCSFYFNISEYDPNNNGKSYWFPFTVEDNEKRLKILDTMIEDYTKISNLKQ